MYENRLKLGALVYIVHMKKEAFKKEAWLLSTGLYISTHIFEVTTKILREKIGKRCFNLY